MDGDSRESATDTIRSRKADHLALCATDDVAFRGKKTLLDDVRFAHRSFPELSVDDVDTTTRLLGKVLKLPLVIAAMTGGHERAREVNRALARVAERRGLGFGLGSQRAMLRDASLLDTYVVRDVAPSTLVLGNLGFVQARVLDAATVERMLRDVGADALCLHASAAMELVQPGGDRDFHDGLDTVSRLSRELSLPVVVKETGSGISRTMAEQLAARGVRYVDTSGAGGTSWVGVETLRAEGVARAVGEVLWDWGVPTAVSIVECADLGMTTIATGGIRTGLDVARAIALGARACGLARPLLQAYERGGEREVEHELDVIEATLRAVMTLTGSRDLSALRTAERVIVGELATFVRAR